MYDETIKNTFEMLRFDTYGNARVLFDYISEYGGISIYDFYAIMMIPMPEIYDGKEYTARLLTAIADDDLKGYNIVRGPRGEYKYERRVE